MLVSFLNVGLLFILISIRFNVSLTSVSTFHFGHEMSLLLSPVLQSQGALAGRLISFSMQDLRTIQVDEPTHYTDPLYPEDEPMARDPITVARGEQCESFYVVKLAI